MNTITICCTVINIVGAFFSWFFFIKTASGLEKLSKTLESMKDDDTYE